MQGDVDRRDWIAKYRDPVVQALEAGQDVTDLDKVTVTGYRQSLQKALDEKRYTTEQVDAIFAEDIGKFPDQNLAESLQRIAGVSIDREGGEGQRISIRGLGSDFTRVRLNGLEALATAGTGTGGVNRSRGFDFNTFASELFSQVKVNKTQSAQMDEGSLGSTVDLRASRPFDFDGFRASASAQVGYGELAEKFDPRVSGLVSNSWADGTFGALLSASYSKRNVYEEGYNPVRWEHGNHRNSNQSNANNNGTYGFCSPVGYDPQTPRNPLSNETPAGSGSQANQDRNNGWGSFGIDANNCGTGLPRPANTPENIAAASPTSYISKNFAPTIFIHGTNDGTVPAQSSIDFYTKLHALGVPSALTLIQGADHAFDNAAFDAIEVMAQSIDLFLDRLMVNPKPYPSFGAGGGGGRGRGGPGGRPPGGGRG